MSLVVMECTSAEAHPDPKVTKMRVYKFFSPKIGELQIVANLTNVYQVGDLAVIATVGTVFEGMLIEERELRGVKSYGMATELVFHGDGFFVDYVFPGEANQTLTK